MTEYREEHIAGGLLAAALGFIAWLLCHHYGQPQYGRSACFIVATTVIVVIVRWDAHRKLWFWLTMLGLIATHVPIGMLIAGPIRHIPIPFMLFFSVADSAVMFGLLRFVEPPDESPKNRKLTG